MHRVSPIALGDLDRRGHGRFHVTFVDRHLLLHEAVHNDRPKRVVHSVGLQRPSRIIFNSACSASCLTRLTPAMLHIMLPRPVGCGKLPPTSERGNSLNLPGGVLEVSS
jgi:hypothetical protein